MLDDFINSDRINEWLEFEHMRVYVRKGLHVFNGYKAPVTLDIANVTVFDQNKGHFTRFLEQAESYDVPIYVENILTDRFANFFIKRGYEIVAASEYDVPSAFRNGKTLLNRKWG